MADETEKMQELVDTMCSMEVENVETVITSVLSARPELASNIVTFAVPDLTYPPARALIERRAEGNIKSFNAEKGFGFIDCKELKDVFGHDVFLHHSQLTGYSVGTKVSFAVMLSKDNKPQAYDLQAQGGGGGGGRNSGNGMGMMGGKGGGGGGYGAWGGGGGGNWNNGPMLNGGAPHKEKKGKEHEGVEIGKFTGSLKSYNDKTAYGFIECPELKQEYGFDVFLLGTDKAGANVGDGVSFTAFVNNSGKPQAKDLEVTESNGGGAKRQRQNEAGGWGWSGGWGGGGKGKGKGW